jgi:hypothetical protein
MGAVLLPILLIAAAGYLLWLQRGEEALSWLPWGLTPATATIAPTTTTSPGFAADFNPTRPAATLIVTSTTPVEASPPTPSQTPTPAPIATKAPVASPPPTSTPTPAPLANSVDEFSGGQGQNNWQYQWSKGRDSFDWVDMQFDGNCWRAPKTGDRVWEDYVRICPTSAHPGVEGDITWRWTSEVSGPIQVEVFARKIDAQGGDGVEVVVYRNTEEIKRWSLAASDTLGFTQQFGLDVKQGDYLFFVLKPAGNSMNDETAFQARVVTALAQ